MIDTIFSALGISLVVLLIAEGASSFWAAPLSVNREVKIRDHRQGAVAPKEREGHAGHTLHRDRGDVFHLSGSVYTRL